jgi:hypothetical protein
MKDAKPKTSMIAPAAKMISEVFLRANANVK